MDIILKNKKLTTKICKTSEERERGMKHQDFTEFESMLFLLGKDYECFWMKDCIIPLDIIIISNNVIVNIHHDCPTCRGNECPSYGGNGNIVLELEGGTCDYLGIEPGDTVEYLF
jgi:uncharacterized membrane protein (UPF0127 family)